MTTSLQKCVDVEAYQHHAGDYVKNAYAPEFNVNGYDEKAAELLQKIST